MCAKKVDVAARREQIVAAAVGVFARKGFAATRVDDVAREAGIAKGSVYLYFASREALLEATFEAYAKDSQAVLQRAVTGAGDVRTRLGSLVRSVLAMVSARPELARILLDLWAAGRTETTPGTKGALDMSAVYRDYRAVVAGLLAEAEAEGSARPGSSERHATVIVGAVEGCLVQWLVDPELPIADLAEPILEVCLDGALSGGRG